MRYICLSYLGPTTWATMPESERKASMEEFFAYEALLRKNGHLVGGEGLQNAQQSVTLRFQNGRVSVTDGPYAETKEQLAGFFILEAQNLTQAIELMSKHPAVRGGSIEIRPAVDPAEMNRRRDQWRASRSNEC